MSITDSLYRCHYRSFNQTFHFQVTKEGDLDVAIYNVAHKNIYHTRVDCNALKGRPPVVSLLRMVGGKKMVLEYLGLLTKSRIQVAETICVPVSLDRAREHLEEGQFKKALQHYMNAYKHGARWQRFVAKSKRGQGELLCLYLVQYQLMDGRPLQAIRLIEKYHTQVKEGAYHILLCALYGLTYSVNMLFVAFKIEGVSPEAMIVYQMVLEKYPEQFQFYDKLAQGEVSSSRKAHVLLKGAEYAMQVQEYRWVIALSTKVMALEGVSSINEQAARALVSQMELPKPYFGSDQWQHYFSQLEVSDAFVPTEVAAVLDRKCPFCTGMKVGDTNLLVYVPQVPLNYLQSLVSIECHPTVFNEIKYKIPIKPYWLLISKDVVTGSRAESLEEQKKLLGKAEVPTLLEVVIAYLAQQCQGHHVPYHDGYTYTRCTDSAGGYPLLVEVFKTGISITADYRFGDADRDVGMMAAQRFDISS